MHQRHYHSDFIGDPFLCVGQITTFERKRPAYFQATGFVTSTRQTVFIVSPVFTVSSSNVCTLMPGMD